VLDSKISITILDDGTPAKYLKKIQRNFPEIKVLKSPFYEEKSNSIEHKRNLENTKIPIDLWLQATENASEYFLLLEDDIWFTQKINLEATREIIKEENVYLLKLFWLNNPKLINGESIKIQDNINIFHPNVFTKKPILHRVIFGIKRYYMQEIMQFLKLYSDEKALHYYSIYGVAGAIFKKEYFLSLWNRHQNQVDENLQLKNAVKFWKHNPAIQFARTSAEILATGFLSSATNKYFETNNFDVFTFNKILNEAWFSGDFDVMQNFPADLDIISIAQILNKENNPKATVADWSSWVTYFKKQFQDIGCKI
jgi:GR25 family glycosyltransferase involved in LPS biosynthesis